MSQIIGHGPPILPQGLLLVTSLLVNYQNTIDSYKSIVSFFLFHSRSEKCYFCYTTEYYDTKKHYESLLSHLLYIVQISRGDRA